MTRRTCQVLRLVLADPDVEFTALQVCDAIGARSGTLYPLLARLEKQGWIVSRWEEREPDDLHRVRRRYHSIAPDRGAEARALVASRGTRLRTGLDGVEAWTRQRIRVGPMAEADFPDAAPDGSTAASRIVGYRERLRAWRLPFAGLPARVHEVFGLNLLASIQEVPDA